MVNGIRTGDPCGFNEGRSSKFREGSQVRQTPEEGRRTYQLKHCGNNHKDEDNCPKTLNDKNHQASSKKLRQPTMVDMHKTKPNKIDLQYIYICTWYVLRRIIEKYSNHRCSFAHEKHRYRISLCNYMCGKLKRI